jgi:hypothetical protein
VDPAPSFQTDWVSLVPIMITAASGFFDFTTVSICCCQSKKS